MGKKANSENAAQSSPPTLAQGAGGVGLTKDDARDGQQTPSFAHLQASLMTVDGSSGLHALQMVSKATAQVNALDLTQTSVLSRVKNFSSIDLTGTINNTIKLDWEAVTVLADSFAASASFGVSSARRVVVSGNAGDVLELVNLSSWSVGAVQTSEALTAQYGQAHQFLAGHGYQAYSLRGATVFVDAAIAVNDAPGTQGAQLHSQGFSIEQLFGPQTTGADSGPALERGGESAGSELVSFKGVAIVFAGTDGAAGDIRQRGHYELSKDGGASWMPLAGDLTDATAVYADKTALLRYVGAQELGTVQLPKLYVRYMQDSAPSEAACDGAEWTGQTLDVIAHTGVAATKQVWTGSDFHPMGLVGSPVSSLFGGGEGHANRGIAITGVDKGQGALFYSTNGGQTWTEVTDHLDAQNALFLRSDADNLVYFKPTDALKMRSADALTIRAWDQSENSEPVFFDTTEEDLRPNAAQACPAAAGEKQELSNLYSLNEDQSVDLSRVMGVKGEHGVAPADLAQMEGGAGLSGKGLPLSLADVLDETKQPGAHQRVLTGQTEAKQVMTESDWLRGPDVLQPNGHDYSVNAGLVDRTALWLIDQQALLSQQGS